MVKTYFKILGVTFLSQVLLFVFAFCFGRLDFLETISRAFFILGFVVPIVLGVIFSIKWFKTTKQKIIGFLLLPTNYTIIFFMIALYIAMGMFIEFLEEVLGKVYE